MDDASDRVTGHIEDMLRCFMGIWQRCKSLPMCQQCWCKKSFLRENHCKILRCFVEKVSNVAIFAIFGQNFWQFCAFMWDFLHLYVTLWPCLHFLVFWAFYAVLWRIKFCCNLSTFLGKIIFAQNLLV